MGGTGERGRQVGGAGERCRQVGGLNKVEGGCSVMEMVQSLHLPSHLPFLTDAPLWSTRAVKFRRHSIRVPSPPSGSVCAAGMQ